MKAKATKFTIRAIPLGRLPEGYSVRYGYADNGKLCKRDYNAWRKFQSIRGYTLEKVDKMLLSIKPNSRAWLVAQAYIKPPTVEGSIFVEYNGEIVAVVCVLMSKLGPEYHHGYVSPDHRGKGIYKAITKLAIEYALKKGFDYLILAPNPELMNFWNRISKVKVFEYEEW